MGLIQGLPVTYTLYMHGPNSGVTSDLYTIHGPNSGVTSDLYTVLMGLIS